MNKLWIAATLGAAFVLSGCISVSDDMDYFKAAAVTAIDNCAVTIESQKKQYRSIIFIHTLPLPESFDNKNLTAAMLRNEAVANAEERIALEGYLQDVVTCNSMKTKSIARYQSDKQKKYDQLYYNQTYILISDLKTGLLSWAEYNRRMSALSMAYWPNVQSLWDERFNDEKKTKAVLSALGQGLAQGAQQYGNAISRAYAPQQQYGSSYAPAPTYEPATTWTSHGNIIQGSNGVTMQTFGNNSTITYPNGQTRSCYTSGTITVITTCSSPPGF